MSSPCGVVLLLVSSQYPWLSLPNVFPLCGDFLFLVVS